MDARRLRVGRPAAALAIFIALAGTAVAADVVPAGRGTRLAFARPAAPVVRERARPALLRDARLAGHGSVPGLHAIEPGGTPTGLVRVIVETSRPEALRDGVHTAGGHVERRWQNRVQVTVPRARMSALAKLDGVTSVQAPPTLVEYAVSGEEAAASLAAAWHAKGFTGKGIKVAVIDGGFAGLAERQASGDLPANVVTADFCGGGINGPDDHGTAVAEIVHEMAPDAALYLLCIDTDVDLAAAASYARSQGVQVINLSGGFYNASRGDGGGSIGAIVDSARAAGILWVSSAGNDAQTHWSGAFADTNGDRVHEFGAGDIGNTFLFPDRSVVCGFLKWDEWPAARSDFDLYLIVSSTGQIIGGSERDQAGTQTPTEEGCVANVSGANVTVAWVIYGYRVAGAPRFDLFTASPPLEYQTAAGSIADPATSPSALAVGAICWQSRGLEPYSSQGPTIDGRLKPDIVGHDSVSGSTYGAFSGCPSAFAGTSASAPEVAGAAALVKQANPTYGPDQLRTYLVSSAQDLGTPGADNATGAGEVRLPAPPDRVAPQATALPSSGTRGRSVGLVSRAGDDSGRVQVLEQVTRNGRVIATLRSSFAAASGSRMFTTGWRAPGNAAGRFQHCVRAKDRAGNTSERSCARITIR
jgi:subtilisin family serine protease